MLQVCVRPGVSLCPCVLSEACVAVSVGFLSSRLKSAVRCGRAAGGMGTNYRGQPSLWNMLVLIAVTRPNRVMNQHKARDPPEWTAASSSNTWRFTATPLTASVSIFGPPPLFMGGLKKKSPWIASCVWGAFTHEQNPPPPAAASSYTKPLWNNSRPRTNGTEGVSEGKVIDHRNGPKNICDHLMISAHGRWARVPFLNFESYRRNKEWKETNNNVIHTRRKVVEESKSLWRTQFAFKWRRDKDSCETYSVFKRHFLLRWQLVWTRVARYPSLARSWWLSTHSGWHHFKSAPSIIERYEVSLKIHTTSKELHNEIVSSSVVQFYKQIVLKIHRQPSDTEFLSVLVLLSLVKVQLEP